MRAYTSADMKFADSYTEEKLGISEEQLIRNAAHGLYLELSEYTGLGKRFVVLCGKGNNGADGYGVALELKKDFENVVCVEVLRANDGSMAKHFAGLCDKAGIEIIDAEKAVLKISSFDVIIDAVFGTGFSGEIEANSPVSRLFETANSSSAVRISADIPSGVCADSGSLSAVHFKAQKTVTFAGAKPGLFSYPAKETCGKVVVADIGIPDSVFDMIAEKYEICDAEKAISLLPERKKNSHKGSFGKALVFAGSPNMSGAAKLALMGALRLGAGLVCLASEGSVIDICSASMCEPIYLRLPRGDEGTDKFIEYSKGCTAVLIGCGIGRDEDTKRRVIRMIKEIDAPIILDADGINVISDNINVLSEAKKGILLLPHPLEFSRISGYDLGYIQENRLACAESFAKEYGVTLLLKGAGTVICEKGMRTCINTSGSSALSKGGSGDVLAGMICALVCDGLSLYDAAVCGAYFHGAAGDSLAHELSEYGVLPSELPERAARLIAEFTNK